MLQRGEVYKENPYNTNHHNGAHNMATKHTCNGGNNPVFGRKTAGCARCDELLAGAAPVRWSGRAMIERQQLADTRAHFSSHKHTSGGCGPVCTFGEW